MATRPATQGNVSRARPARLYSPALLLLTLTVAISYLGVGFVLPLRALYGQKLGASSFEIGLMASAALLTGFLFAPPIGWLADRVGQRPVLWVGLLVHGGLVVAYIFVSDPVYLIGLRGLEGIAIVGILPPARALMNIIAPGERQGEALGLLGSAQMVGITLGPALGTLLASQIGYSAAFLAAAAPLFIGAVLARLFLPAGRPQLSTSLLTDTAPEPELERRGRRGRRRARRGRRGEGSGELSPERVSPGRGALFTAPLLLAYGLTAALSLTTGAISSVWAIYLAARGASLELIGLSYTSFAIIALVLAPVAGRVSDRRGRYVPLVLAMVLYMVVYAVYAVPLSALALVIISGIEGISGAVARSAVDGFLADVAPPSMRGRAQANYSAAGTGAAFAMALASGALYGIYPGLPFAAVALAFVFTTLLLFLPSIRHRFPSLPIASPSLELELEALERQ